MSFNVDVDVEDIPGGGQRQCTGTRLGTVPRR